MNRLNLAPFGSGRSSKPHRQRADNPVAGFALGLPFAALAAERISTASAHLDGWRRPSFAARVNSYRTGHTRKISRTAIAIVGLAVSAIRAFGADATMARLTVAQPVLTVSALPQGGGWDLRLSVPASIPVTEYDVEISYRDPGDGNWRYPGTIVSGYKGGNGAIVPVTRSTLQKFSPQATEWRLRARHAQPPGPWSDWKEFNSGGAAVGVGPPTPAATGAPGSSALGSESRRVEAMAAALAAQLEALRVYAALLGREGREDSAMKKAADAQALAEKMKKLQDDMKSLQENVDKLRDAVRESGRTTPYQKKP